MNAVPLGTEINTAATPEPDVWPRWLLHDRYGRDAAFGKRTQATIERYADRVLDNARLAPGMTLVDIGTGDGLVPFRAIRRIGPSLHAIFTDSSAQMLAHAEAVAAERGVRAQCRFIHCGAQHMEALPDTCADVVTSRAVLAYVADKPAALREIRRILKPGGRLSMAEPVFREEALAAAALKKVVEALPPEADGRFLTLLHRWKSLQFPDTEEKIAQNPLVNFSERDLLRHVQDAGFPEIHLELHIDVTSAMATTWEEFVHIRPHPWASSLAAVLPVSFDAAERAYFELVIRASFEAGALQTVERVAFMTAEKEPAGP